MNSVQVTYQQGVFGLEEAAEAIEKENYVIIVPWETLAEAYWQAGVENAVAIGGQITQEHAEALLYWTNNVSYHATTDALAAAFEMRKDLFERMRANYVEVNLSMVGAYSYPQIYSTYSYDMLFSPNWAWPICGGRGSILTIKDRNSCNSYQLGQPILMLSDDLDARPGYFPYACIGKSGKLIRSWIDANALKEYDGYKENKHFLQLSALWEYCMKKITYEELESIAGSIIAEDADLIRAFVDSEIVRILKK